MNALFVILTVLIIIAAFLLIIVVLLQNGKGEGLASLQCDRFSVAEYLFA